MTSIRPHVKAVQHPNPTHRSFHITRDVTEGGCDQYGFGGSYGFGREKVGDLGKLLMSRLQAIPGVTSGFFHSYEITISIGEAFDWGIIGPIVVGEIVNTVFPETFGKTIEISAQVGWSYYVSPGRRIWDEEDDGQRVRYKTTAKREVVEVKDPQILDIERFLNTSAVDQAQQKAQSGLLSED